MNLNYIQNIRGLSFIEKGMRIQNTNSGKFGIIQGENESGNLDILFEGETIVRNCHPTWAMKYFDKQGKVIAEYDK